MNRSGISNGLKLFNTISERKETFESTMPGHVRMFVCGPTIQDYIHVGHARTYVFYDLLARYLKYLGYRVDFLLNITDIDESIVKGAKRERQTIRSFLKRNEEAFLSDMRGLRISTVNSFERVSRYLPVMIQQTAGLVRNGSAYIADGSVFFDVSKFHDFGKLSHQTRDQLALRPLEISPKKRNQIDFSLWRSTTSAEQRWRSPWGLGTPGWHIQDTAVTMANFGPQYDIHGGARELIYPHHESEVAQAEALTGLKPFVKYWVHTGLLTTDGKKMSKSEGNVYYVHDLLRKHDANALRLYFAGLHHRKDAEFDEGSINRIEERYWELRSKAQVVRRRKSRKSSSDTRLLQPFLRALDDDLNGSLATDCLAALINEGARESDAGRLGNFDGAIAAASKILGVGLVDDPY